MQVKRSFLFMSGLLLIAGTVYGGNGDLIVNGQVGVGTTTPSSSAAVDVTSTTKGFLPPRMTTAQRNAIASPTKGLLIFNTTDNALNAYDGSSWVVVGGQSGGTCPCGTCWAMRDNGSYNDPNYALTFTKMEMCTPAGWKYTGDRDTSTFAGG